MNRQMFLKMDSATRAFGRIYLVIIVANPLARLHPGLFTSPCNEGIVPGIAPLVFDRVCRLMIANQPI